VPYSTCPVDEVLVFQLIVALEVPMLLTVMLLIVAAPAVKLRMLEAWLPLVEVAVELATSAGTATLTVPPEERLTLKL